MKERNILRKVLKGSTFSQLFNVLLMVVVIAFSSCAREESIINHTGAFEKTLTVSAYPTDSLTKSYVTFDQAATMTNSTLDIDLSLSPFCYCNITLSKPQISIKEGEDLSAIVVNSKVISQTPFEQNSRSGEDVIEELEFSDGQTATLSYGYNFEYYNTGDEDSASPHVVIDSIRFHSIQLDSLGIKTDTTDTYRATLTFEVNYSHVGTTYTDGNYTIMAKPWYYKVITTDPLIVEKVEYYDGKYVGCPIQAYEVTEIVTTNKGVTSTVYRVDLTSEFNAPKKKEQPTLDSLFNEFSTGKLEERKFSEAKNADGFTIRTMTGTYTSSNTGKEKNTVIQSTVNFNYQFPTMLETQYGKHNISPLTLKFEELGFNITTSKKTETNISYNSINSVQAILGTCELDVLDEEVSLTLERPKTPDVIKVDSVYTLTGEGDEYNVEKKIIYNDGSTSVSKYSYTGRHNIRVINFGEVYTSNTQWKANPLQKVDTKNTSEEKKFATQTKFVITNQTSTWQSTATNNTQSGNFAFEETSPIVKFIDGSVEKIFPERKYNLTDIGADLATNPVEVNKNGKTYDAYAYNYTISSVWNQSTAQTLVSEGTLLIEKDVVGQVTYKTEKTWSGKTVTLKVIKTTPHSLTQDEVETYTKDFTVSMSNLSYDKLYAENTNFATTSSVVPTNTSSEDGFWTTNARKRSFVYNVSNQAVNREMPQEVNDAVITFNDGTFSHTFDISLNITKAEKFNSSFVDGLYTVTPHILTITAQTDGKSFTTEGKTDIYVKTPVTVKDYTKKTVVYNDGSVDFILTKKMSDNTTQTITASNTYGSRFAFDFKNATSQTKVVTNVTHTASSRTSTPSTSSNNQDKWKVSVSSNSYIHTLDNQNTSDKVESPFTYKTFSAVYEDTDLGNVSFNAPSIRLSNKAYTLTELGLTDGYYEYNASIDVSAIVNGDEGSYSTELGVDHKLKVKDNKPDGPNLGKPKSFYVSATYDPTTKVTRRAFCFNWEDGVTYAVCDYETMLPNDVDFKYEISSYSGYNSVGYNKNGSKWQPARGSDDSDAIRWYDSNSGLISAIDKAVSCKTIGWKNIVDDKYSLIIPGYTYVINGYEITVTAPNGEKVTFNSHYKE